MVYISKQQILTRFRRYKALNETRLQRTCALMGPQARWGLEVVPLLLHYNHICLPGYRSGYIPHGIDLFTPNEIQQQYLRSQLSESLSEAYDEMAQLPAQSAAEAQERLEYEARNAELLAQIPPLEEPVQHDILGLYAMGSTSSIGQSQSSDLDIWVCVRANISAEGMSALQDKCRFITTYVKSQGVELNLFVTPEDRFTNFQPDQLDEENCGSAQNLFLLDEFYRSSIRLCGRYIIWYLISTKEEQSAYQDYVNFLLEGRSNLPHFVPRLPVTLATVGLDPAPAPASASVSAQSSAQGLSHGGSHGISQGVSQGISQGVSQGVSQGISQGVSQGMSHGSSHGMSHVMMSSLIGDDESSRWYNQHALEHLMELPDPNDEEGDDEEVAADAAAADEAAADAFALEAASADPTPRERERPLRRIKGWYHKLAGKAESAERADSELSAAAVPEGGPAQSEWSEVTQAQAALPEATVASPEQAGPAAFDPRWSAPMAPVSSDDSVVGVEGTPNSGLGRLVQAMGVSGMPLWGDNVASALSYASALNEGPEGSDLMRYASADVREVRTSRDPTLGAAQRKQRRRGGAAALALPSLKECEALALRDGWVEGEAPLDAAEWFDFGSVVKSSPTEYFGSGLWLLYKGIDSPFKVVLKILLMEAYSSSYPNTRLLSSELKDYMLSHDGYSLDLDSYYLMYLKVSQYLQEAGGGERLELMRKCFYLKLFMGLNHYSASHRDDYEFKRELLDKLSTRWGWKREFLTELENVASWKMNQARGFNREVFNTLLESYLALLRFSVRHGIEYAITSDDAGVLSRKLYAAFDRYPGKILVMHTSLFHNLEERHLTFICPSPHSLCRKGWHLYTAADYNIDLLNQRVTYIGTRLSEVVAWACFNGMMTLRTKIHVAGSSKVVTPAKIKQLSSDITRVLGSSMNHVSEQSMQSGFRLKSCVVVVNLEEDNTGLLNSQVLDLDYGSTLCCGHQRLCLVGSVDLIVVNTWGEALTISLPSGEEGVVELLATLLRIVTNSISLSSLVSAEPVPSSPEVGVNALHASALAQSAIGIGAQAVLSAGGATHAYAEGLISTAHHHDVLPEPPRLLGARAAPDAVEFTPSPAPQRNSIATSEELTELLSHIEVCSYAASYQDLIKYDLESALRQVCNCLLSTSSSEYVFEVGRNTYIARAVGERGVKINRKSVFGSNDFDISVVPGYGMRPEFALQVPPIVDRYASTGIVQYFFMPLPDKGHWDIYIVNERNEVNIYHDYYGSRASLVNAINRFYTQQSQNRLARGARFNLPQYYVLSQDQRSLHPFTIRSD